MSLRYIVSVLDTPLPPLDKLILLAIANCANDEGYGWPSIGHMAKVSGASDATVRRTLRRLSDPERPGGPILTITSRQRPDNSASSNGYQINSLTLTPHVSLTPPPVTVTPPPVTQTPPPVTVTPHEPVREPVSKKDSPPQKKTPAPPRDNEARRQHSWFVAWFCWSCQQVSGSKLAFDRADAAIIRKLLDSLGFETLMDRATYYLCLDEAQRFPRGSPSVKGLKLMVNDIAGKGGVDTDRRCITLGILPADMDLAHFAPWKDKAAA